MHIYNYNIGRIVLVEELLSKRTKTSDNKTGEVPLLIQSVLWYKPILWHINIIILRTATTLPHGVILRYVFLSLFVCQLRTGHCRLDQHSCRKLKLAPRPTPIFPILPVWPGRTNTQPQTSRLRAQAEKRDVAKNGRALFWCLWGDAEDSDCLFVYWSLTAPSTAQSPQGFSQIQILHVSHVLHSKYNTQKQTKTVFFSSSKNRTFLCLALANNSNTSGTCWYRWLLSIIYQYQFTKTC